jgi:hypothetical protein
MGMFDHYIPDPPLRCPVCGSALNDWQGKDGPNALFVWRQGVAAPIDQAIDDEDVRLEPHQLATFRLPENFLIYEYCCGRHFPLEADCRSTKGIWTHIELETAETATQRKDERRHDFKARLRWLGGKSP